jgi:hypothetical protein
MSFNPIGAKQKVQTTKAPMNGPAMWGVWVRPSQQKQTFLTFERKRLYMHQVMEAQVLVC